MASIAGLQAATTAPLVYSVAKAGVIQLTKSTAADQGKNNIRVNAISPGFILTDIYNDSIKAAGVPESMLPKIKEQMAKNASKAQPLPKAGTPDDIAKSCLFLASDQSSFITGANFVIDGGMTTGPKEAWDLEAQKARMQALLSPSATKV